MLSSVVRCGTLEQIRLVGDRELDVSLFHLLRVLAFTWPLNWICTPVL